MIHKLLMLIFGIVFVSPLMAIQFYLFNEVDTDVTFSSNVNWTLVGSSPVSKLLFAYEPLIFKDPRKINPYWDHLFGTIDLQRSVAPSRDVKITAVFNGKKYEQILNAHYDAYYFIYFRKSGMVCEPRLFLNWKIESNNYLVIKCGDELLFEHDLLRHSMPVPALGDTSLFIYVFKDFREACDQLFGDKTSLTQLHCGWYLTNPPSNVNFAFTLKDLARSAGVMIHDKPHFSITLQQLADSAGAAIHDLKKKTVVVKKNEKGQLKVVLD